MSPLRPKNLALLGGAALIVASLLTGCSAPASSSASGGSAGAVPTSTPAASGATGASPTPTATPSSTGKPGSAGATDYTAFCDANRTAAAAKAGTVGEDMRAVDAQTAAIRELMPMTGVGADVAAGAEVFAASAEETSGILATFPPDALVSDVGLDPKFTQSDAVKNAASDPNYQAFIAWTIQTCGFGN